MIEIKDTGAFLHQKRISAGYTMQEAAVRLKVSMALLSRAEHGAIVTGDTFARLMKLYRVTPEEREIIMRAYIEMYRIKKYK